MKISQQFKVKAAISAIAPYLLDLKKYAEIHPLIYDAVRLESLDKVEFKIYEKPFHFIPIPITYKAEVKHSGNKISYYIKGLPFKKVEIEYFLESKNDQETDINFHLNIESFLPGKKILMKKMVQAQKDLMRNMNESLT